MAAQGAFHVQCEASDRESRSVRPPHAPFPLQNRVSGVSTTVWTGPETTLTPMCAFMPKNHWFPSRAGASGRTHARPVLRRARGTGDRRIDQRAPADHLATRPKQSGELLEEGHGEVVALEEVSEAQGGDGARKHRRPTVTFPDITTCEAMNVPSITVEWCPTWFPLHK